jgi:hypothetical protein
MTTREELIKVLEYVHDALFSSAEPWLVEARDVIRAVLDGDIS